ncbi:cyclic lactone autoinducer peptide [Aminipila butyrica]|uniref:Cyclic lactone autoinducer peptide n=1 Tax=Aminipila butyrica TaxID=433296 RepID=A0A858BRG9_9FIRM|nr:cyclic lactone autoinducer peptide [Aminipila butyrica]QIB68483.1 cyclic lactone autoinducer peptide [Aminipila butyrica]
MFKKFQAILLSTTALFLIGVATSAISVASLGYHGEPECPEALLK